MIVAALLLAGCGTASRLGFGDKPEKEASQADPLARPNTPTSRATQVAWTAARAQYCAFGLNRQKLRAEYLAYEGSQGASPEEMQRIARTYDLTFEAFYTRVREIPNYCTRTRIEEIRPDINRHLAGDYTPSQRKPPEPDSDAPNPYLPRGKDNPYEEYDKDPAQNKTP
jgi:hypothetical protein